MKLFKKPLLIPLLVAFVLPCFQLRAQDSEKDKIIHAIQDEVKAFLEKDKARWEGHWIHANYTKITFASAGFYSEIAGWDSLRASRQRYFDSPEKSTSAIEKDNITARVNGNMAVASLTSKVTGALFGLTVQEETLILEKENGDWKISEIFIFVPATYEANDANVEGNLNDQGYKLISMKKNAEALKVFQLNTELFPGAWNTWDSLAEVYMIMGDDKKAIRYYEKSLALNPKNDNARKYLEKLKEAK